MIVRDPQIRFGRFRVLQRTDALFIVVDENAPLGMRTLFTHSELELAIETARELAQLHASGDRWDACTLEGRQ